MSQQITWDEMIWAANQVINEECPEDLRYYETNEELLSPHLFAVTGMDLGTFEKVLQSLVNAGVRLPYINQDGDANPEGCLTEDCPFHPTITELRAAGADLSAIGE